MSSLAAILAAVVIASLGSMSVLAQSDALDCDLVLAQPSDHAVSDVEVCRAEQTAAPAAEADEPSPDAPSGDPAPADEPPAPAPAAASTGDEGAAPAAAEDAPAPASEDEAPAAGDEPADLSAIGEADEPVDAGDEPDPAADPADEPADDPADDPADEGDEPSDTGDEPSGAGDEPTDAGDDPADEGDDPSDEGAAGEDDPADDPAEDPAETTDAPAPPAAGAPEWNAATPPPAPAPAPVDEDADTDADEAPADAEQPAVELEPRELPEGAGDTEHDAHQHDAAVSNDKRVVDVPEFQDARTFRENYDVKGRIPELPELDEASLDAITFAGESTNVAWSMIAAVAWMETRWGDPAAGTFAGSSLDDASWNAYGVDADGNGVVERDNTADGAATVANFLSIERERQAQDGARRPMRQALAAYFGDKPAQARRARFLSAYYDAVGTQAIEHGLDDLEAREQLTDRMLNDPDIFIYPGGRSDIEAGLVDPRVMVTIAFLSNRYKTITISSLISGHGVFTSSGNVSLHSYGQGVDIAALNGKSILGNQSGPKSITVKAVKDVLRMPGCMQPRELITLWDLGGASFAASDHHDHVHIGYGDFDADCDESSADAASDAHDEDDHAGHDHDAGVPPEQA